MGTILPDMQERLSTCGGISKLMARKRWPKACRSAIRAQCMRRECPVTAEKGRSDRVPPLATSLGGGRAGLERAADALHLCRDQLRSGLQKGGSLANVRGLASPRAPLAAEAVVRAAVGYIRVSTSKQRRSGLGLETQQAALAKFAEAEKFTIIETFTETESGSDDDRFPARPGSR